MSNNYFYSVNNKKWTIKAIEERKVNKLIQDLNISDFLARIICTRLTELNLAEDFIYPSLKKQLPSPMLLKDMDIAVERISIAFINNERIAIFGDYDVDGATSSAVLYKTFKSFGIEPLIYIPDRMNEGYGPNNKALKELKDKGISLVITVDCGMTAFKELDYAKNIDLDIIVLDHHAPEAKLPSAIAVINPNRIDDDTGLGMMAAVGVSFMLAGALKSKLKNINFINSENLPNLSSILDLVALGTICDVVPLVGPNRALVKQGLRVMAKTQNIGIKALFEVAEIEDIPNVFHAGFMLGPRINAGGRVGEAGLGAKLLTTDDKNEAKEISYHLNMLNEERKKLESNVLEEAKNIALENKSSKVLVLSNKEWHTGVIGIVASRIVELFNKPTIVISENGENSKGSGRSIMGIDIGRLITAAKQSNILINGGGHPMACGLTMNAERINDLRKFLNKPDASIDKINDHIYSIDLAVSISGAIPDLIKELKLLEPFGSGNSEPKFIIKNVNLFQSKIVGENHVKCIITDSSNARIDAIAFRCIGTPLGKSLLNNRYAHIIGRLKLSEWNGRERLQMHIDDVIEL